MRRWGWLLWVGVSGLVACGPAAQRAPTGMPGTTGSDPLPSAGDVGLPEFPPSGLPQPDGNPGVPDTGLPDPGPLTGQYPAVQTRVPVFELQIAPEDLAK